MNAAVQNQADGYINVYSILTQSALDIICGRWSLHHWLWVVLLIVQFYTDSSMGRQVRKRQETGDYLRCVNRWFFFFFFQFWHFLNVIYFYCGYYPAVVVATELGDGLESLRSWWNVRWDRGSISIACSTCRVSVKRTNGALKSCTISPIKSVRLFSISLSVSMNYQWIDPVQVIRDRKSALGDTEIALDRQTDSVDHEVPKSTS